MVEDQHCDAQDDDDADHPEAEAPPDPSRPLCRQYLATRGALGRAVAAGDEGETKILANQADHLAGLAPCEWRALHPVRLH